MGIGTFMMVALAGWINRQQQEVIDYLQEEGSCPQGFAGPEAFEILR
jgi:hypothetical protein